VTSAPCTVQIVRDQTKDHAHTLASARRVLFATDGSETSIAAAEALAGRPWPEGSEFRIVTVEEPWLVRPPSTILNINSAEEALASAGLKATAAVLVGNPKEVILEDAKNWNADLIVVGSHGRRGFKRFLLGSVSEAVAMNAHCSVVVVRDPAQPSRKSRA
jgi:nucleotide-binding universal stress UspA family protein